MRGRATAIPVSSMHQKNDAQNAADAGKGEVLFSSYTIRNATSIDRSAAKNSTSAKSSCVRVNIFFFTVRLLSV